MSRPEESLLQGRVIFVEGAPRSGTTLLAMVLSVHPEIDGSATESHLFDYGVERLFENHEDPVPHHSYLASYVSREQLVKAVRELGDTVLTGGRSDEELTAKYVLEKTPTVPPNPELPITRKLECYPDAWYIHLVRRGEDAALSATDAGWYPTRSAALTAWTESVDAIRSVLSDHERYREVRYEDLAADPGGVTSGLFEWLGLPVDESLAEQVSQAARQRVARLPQSHGSAPGRLPATAVSSPADKARRFLRRSGARLSSLLKRRSTTQNDIDDPATHFMLALRDGSRDRLEAIASRSVEVTLRTGSGDDEAQAEQAISLLVSIGSAVWGAPFVWESEAISKGGSFTTVLYSGLRTGAERVDVSFAILVDRGLISRVSIISAGDLRGRPARNLQRD